VTATSAPERARLVACWSSHTVSGHRRSQLPRMTRINPMAGHQVLPPGGHHVPLHARVFFS